MGRLYELTHHNFSQAVSGYSQALDMLEKEVEPDLKAQAEVCINLPRVSSLMNDLDSVAKYCLRAQNLHDPRLSAQFLLLQSTLQGLDEQYPFTLESAVAALCESRQRIASGSLRNALPADISVTIKNVEQDRIQQELNQLKWTMAWSVGLTVLAIVVLILATWKFVRNMKKNSALEKKRVEDRFAGEIEILQNQLIELREKRGVMPTEKAEELVKRLIMLVESEELYKNPEIGLEPLADRLEVNRTYLSQAVNSLWGNNLNDFINYFRIKEARNLLLKAASQNKSLLTIAFEVGFNSKSTFNRVFKEKTGLTPGQYIQLRKS